MKKLDIAALALLIVGGLNWGLVGIAKFDLVAAIAGGLEFGETNWFSRVIYCLVGAAAVRRNRPAARHRTRRAARYRPRPLNGEGAPTC